jgi:hypothetical protein
MLWRLTLPLRREIVHDPNRWTPVRSKNSCLLKWILSPIVGGVIVALRPISQELLLSFYEGKTINFLVQRADRQEIINGKVLSGDSIRMRTGKSPNSQ